MLSRLAGAIGLHPKAPFGAIHALAPGSAKRVAPQVRRDERSVRVSGSGSRINAGVIWPIDTNTETKGDKWYGRLGKGGVSATMLRTPAVIQAVDAVVNPPCAASWRFKPPVSDKTALGKEKADFANMCFFERIPWALVIERMFHGVTVDGFHLAEMTDQIQPVDQDRFPLHPGRGRGLVPTGIYDIPACTVSYWHAKKDEPTKLESIDQYQPPTDEEAPGYRTITADRIIRVTAGQVGSNFAGVPIIRPGYAAWKLLLAFERYRAIAIERTSCGTPTATPKEADDYDKDEADAVELALENMRTMAKGSLVLPPGYELKWEGAGENDVTNCNIAIESLKTDLAVMVTAGFLRLGLVGPGSYALSNTQAGQYHLSTVRRTNLVVVAFQFGLDGWSPVKRIIEANYGVGASLPILQARGLPTKDVKQICDLTYRGIQTGVIRKDDALEEELRELIGIGPHDPDTAHDSGEPEPDDSTDIGPSENVDDDDEKDDGLPDGDPDGDESESQDEPIFT